MVKVVRYTQQPYVALRKTKDAFKFNGDKAQFAYFWSLYTQKIWHEVLHQTYDLTPTIAGDEIGLLSQKDSAPNTIEGLYALLDDVITCLALVIGENKPHLL